MNSIVLIGRLTRDPEMRYIPSSGKAVADFTLAVDRAYGDKTDFIRIKVWGKQAENVGQYLKKGSQCAVQGELNINTWDGKDGTRQYMTEVNANRVQFLSTRQQESYEQPTPVEDDFPIISDEDVPF